MTTKTFGYWLAILTSVILSLAIVGGIVLLVFQSAAPNLAGLPTLVGLIILGPVAISSWCIAKYLKRRTVKGALIALIFYTFTPIIILNLSPYGSGGIKGPAALAANISLGSVVIIWVVYIREYIINRRLV